MHRLSIAILVLLITALSTTVVAKTPAPAETNRLAVLWTSGDPDVAERVALMYTHVAKTAEWFD